MVAEYSESLYKEILLRTMKAFVDFCKQHEIEYVGAYGTVLGAVRHHGLIPWDDDIDVCMTRANYEKFLKLKSQMAGTGYEIVDLDDKGYYLPFAKFCDANTTLWEVENLPFVLGVFIDVFPLDCVSEDDAACENLRDGYKTAFDKYTHSLKKFKFTDVLTPSGAKSFARSVCNSLTVNRDTLKALESQMMEIKGQFRMYYRSMDSYKKSKFRGEWFEDCVDVPYEDFSIRIPREYDAYLKQCYGDYMKLPPEEKRVSQHYHYFVDLEKRLTIEEIKRIKNGK